MAEMCFSAYKTRLNTAGYEQYTADVANDWREDLVEMFSHAASKGTIKQDAATRHVVPRLVVLVPQPNEKKEELVKDFATHYEHVQGDMVAIDKIVDSGCKIDDHFITELRERLQGLHSALSKGENWRNIMPYVPLPVSSLRALGDLIKSSRPYYLLGDLISNIEEILGWITSRPTSFKFPAGLIDDAMETLREVTEDKIAKTGLGPDAQQMAEYREQKAESLRLQKEEQDRQQEKKRLEITKRLKAEHEQLKQRIQSLEMTVAKERAQESARKLTEAVVVAQREKSYQDQITHNTAEIDRLKTDLANLAAKQREKTKPEVNLMPLSQSNPGQLATSISSSFSSNPTSNSSFYQPQSSLATSFGSSANSGSYGQGGSFGQAPHQPTPKEVDVPMMDAQRPRTSREYATNSGQVSISDSGIRMAGQYNSSNVHTSNDVSSPPLGSSDGNFKAACPAYKNGTCMLGRACKLPHTACRFWLHGNCTYGGRCNRSHDPFFLTETSKLQPKQSSRFGQMAIDSVTSSGPSDFSRTNPFSSHSPPTADGSNPFTRKTMKNGQSVEQNSQQVQSFGSHPGNMDSFDHASLTSSAAARKAMLAERTTRDEQRISCNDPNSFSHQNPPTGPRNTRSLTARITRDDEVDSSHVSKQASDQIDNLFGHQTPPTRPPGSNFLIKGIVKQDKPISTKDTMFTYDNDYDNASNDEAAPTNSRRRNPLFDRITKNDQPISQPGQTFRFTNAGNAFDQRDSIPNMIPPPRENEPATLNNIACKNNFKGKCNKGDICPYAHNPCPRFLDGTCRFGQTRCRKSHDAAFLAQTLSHPRPQAHPDAHHSFIEHSLGDIFTTAGVGVGIGPSKTHKQAKQPGSETLCRWQMTSPNECTNPECGFKHEPPKRAQRKEEGDERRVWSIRNAFSQVGEILRGIGSGRVRTGRDGDGM